MGNSSDIYFFATKTDLLSIIKNVEQFFQLKYIRSKSYNSKDIPIYNTLEEYDMLGINTSGDHQSESFLVLEKTSSLNIREVPQNVGGVKYFIDQMNNQNSIILWPGGIYNGEFLVCGHLGTINKNELSRKLFNTFQRSVKKQCGSKVGRFYIGDEAKTSYSKMRFITINVNQSTEYDLKLDF